MTDAEFDVLDELYFVISYAELERESGVAQDELIGILNSLFSQNWLRVYQGPDKECDSERVDIDANFNSYYYLASKEGLHAHNRQ